VVGKNLAAESAVSFRWQLGLSAIVATEHEKLGLSERRCWARRGNSNAGKVGDALPAAAGSKSIGVFEPDSRRLAIAAGFEVGAAKQIDRPTLNANRREHSAWT